MNATDTAPLLTLRDVARLMGVHYEVARRMDAERVLPDPVLPRTYRARWRRIDIEAWLGIGAEGDRL